MIITFKEKENKKYELQSERVEQIFNTIKDGLTSTFEQFEDNEKELFIALLASVSITSELKEYFSNKYGIDKIIEITEAKEIE